MIHMHMRQHTGFYRSPGNRSVSLSILYTTSLPSRGEVSEDCQRLLWTAPMLPDGMRGDPEEDLLGKGLNHNSVGPRGGINQVDYGKAKRH